MPETFNITFSGLEGASTVVNDIRHAIEELEAEAQIDDELDRNVPEILVSSGQVEPVLQQFLWDAMTAINNQATVSESDFEGAL